MTSVFIKLLNTIQGVFHEKSMFLLLLMTYATYSISAVEVSKTQAHSLHEMGHISVHGDPTVLSPEAAKMRLTKSR